jgi:calcineurin-like phosphoesterase
MGAVADAIIVDMHCEATSEKMAMGHFCDGRASLVVGTHTHVQTADETIFPGGTGYLTDAGMCGPEESILGRGIDSVLWRFKTGMPTRFPIARGPVRICGVIADIDPATGRCLAVRRVSLPIPETAPENGTQAPPEDGPAPRQAPHPPGETAETAPPASASPAQTVLAGALSH